MKLVFAAAVCIVKDSKLLLLREKESGKWGPPAGHSNDAEELTATAIRETKEETNLDVELTGLVQAALLKRSKDKYYLVCVYTADAKDLSALEVQEEEVVDHNWVSLEEIQNDKYVLRDKVLKSMFIKALTSPPSPIDTFAVTDLEEYVDTKGRL